MEKFDDVVNVLSPSSESNRFTLMGSKNWHHVKNFSVNPAIFYLLCSRSLTNKKEQYYQFKNQTYWSHNNTLVIRASISLAENSWILKGGFPWVYISPSFVETMCTEIFSTLTAVVYFWTHLLWSMIKYMLKWQLSSVKLIGQQTDMMVETKVHHIWWKNIIKDGSFF